MVVSFAAVAMALAVALLTQGGGAQAQSRRPPSYASPPPRAAAPGSCPERFGRYPVGGQCDAYVECLDGVAEQKLCPDGLLFNPNASHYAYPCQYPAEVDCNGRAGLQAAQPTEGCPHRFGYFRAAREASACGGFVTCVDGRAFALDCPEGLAFDEDSLRCDWPDLVASCDAEAFLGFRCPDAASAPPSPSYRAYRSPDDCSKYFVCIEGRPRLYRCAADEAFNEDAATCDDPRNVTACAHHGAVNSNSLSPTRRF